MRSILLLLALSLAARTHGADLCTPVGWCTQNGGTTGGGNAAAVTVTTLADLQTQVAGTVARNIYVQGTMGAGVGTRVAMGSNKTVYGLPGATLIGGIDINGDTNVIIRNLRIQGPGAIDVDGVDCVGVQNSTNVWLDHLEIWDGQDGNLDITNNANYVCVTWTKFHYTAASTNHQFCNLIGSSDTRLTDRGTLKVTFLGNWWSTGVRERMPRVRFGQVHMANNLFMSPGNNHCVRAGIEADILVENNAFINVDEPIDLYEGNYTAVTQRNNLFTGTTGNTAAPGGAFTPPYTLVLEPASAIQAMVQARAGAILGASGCGSVASPTRTPVVAPTLTRSPTRTATLSPTGTMTATRTGTPSTTRTATATATRTNTVAISATSSATRTATPTATRTATATASPTATTTRTPSPTFTGTLTRTATRTSSATPTTSWSPSASPSASATPTRSPTGTLSASSSPTLSATRTPTQTASPSQTLSWTPSPLNTLTPTPTITAIRTNSPTQTASPSQTLSWTPSPLNTLTPTPTVTATPTSSSTQTASPSQTLSWTPSPLNTLTPTPTVTLTGSPTRTASPTGTMTATLSSSPTGTVTPTATGTASPTVTLTATPSPLDTRTPTSTVTLSGTPTATSSVTPTPTPTQTATPTFSATPSNTALPTGTATFSPTATHTTIPSPTGTMTAVPTQQGPLEIVEIKAVPNPDPHSLKVLLKGGADQATVRLWSVALVLLAEHKDGPLGQGWSTVRLPREFRRSVPNGTYYLTLEVQRGSEKARSKALKVVFVR